jgi:hypothetical protein
LGPPEFLQSFTDASDGTFAEQGICLALERGDGERLDKCLEIHKAMRVDAQIADADSK